MVQLMLTYYGIPLLLRYINMKANTGWNINNVSPIVFAVVAFALNEAAYTSETIRAAIQAVDSGEIEAAKSLGMTNAQITVGSLSPMQLLLQRQPSSIP